MIWHSSPLLYASTTCSHSKDKMSSTGSKKAYWRSHVQAKMSNDEGQFTQATWKPSSDDTQTVPRFQSQSLLEQSQLNVTPIDTRFKIAHERNSGTSCESVENTNAREWFHVLFPQSADQWSRNDHKTECQIRFVSSLCLSEIQGDARLLRASARHSVMIFHHWRPLLKNQIEILDTTFYSVGWMHIARDHFKICTDGTQAR